MTEPSHYREITMEKAYARVGEDGVQYSGPKLPDQTSELRLAVFGPKADELVRSPVITTLLEELNRTATHRISLIGIASDVQWGKASSALVQALYDQHAIGIIATNRDSSHLAEQLGVKDFVPVIAISSDHSLTSTNIPWIFRLPDGTSPDQAIRCFAEAINKSAQIARKFATFSHPETRSPDCQLPDHRRAAVISMHRTGNLACPRFLLILACHHELARRARDLQFVIQSNEPICLTPVS